MIHVAIFLEISLDEYLKEFLVELPGGSSEELPSEIPGGILE